jgi:hypothetical protein
VYCVFERERKNSVLLSEGLGSFCYIVSKLIYCGVCETHLHVFVSCRSKILGISHDCLKYSLGVA